MKYLRLLKKYFAVIVGALLFGLAATKVKSAQRAENKASDKIRDMTLNDIESTDEDIDKSVTALKVKQKRAKEAKENAVKRLDKIAKNSDSVGSLLDEYNRTRV